jgi:hypothetical protein
MFWRISSLSICNFAVNHVSYCRKSQSTNQSRMNALYCTTVVCKGTGYTWTVFIIRWHKTSFFKMPLTLSQYGSQSHTHTAKNCTQLTGMETYATHIKCMAFTWWLLRWTHLQCDKYSVFIKICPKIYLDLSVKVAVHIAKFRPKWHLDDKDPS